MAIVTGGGSGIGFAIAEKFVRSGILTIIVGRDPEKLSSAEKRLGGLFHPMAQDLNDLAAIPGLVRRIIERYDHIDILVNNAGINMKKELPGVSDEDFDRILHTNLRSLGFEFWRDTRPNKFYPVNGTVFDFTSDFFGTAIGSKYTFQSYKFTFNKYFSLPFNQVLAYNLASLVRRYFGTQRRDVVLERELVRDLDESSHALDAGFVAASSSPSQRAVRREQAVQLADALGRLPADYREVIILRQLEGLSNLETAQVLQIDPATTSRRYGRAVIRLRNLLLQSGLMESQS